MQHKRDRSTFLLRDRRKCPICKSQFYGSSEDWVYKRPRARGTYNFMCSYKCLQEYDKTNRTIIKEHNRITRDYINDMLAHIEELQATIEKEEDEQVIDILTDEIKYCEFEIMNRKY